MKPIVKTPPSWCYWEREGGPTSMGSKRFVVRCGKTERHKHSMRKCRTRDNKKWNILIPSCYSHKTPNPLLFTLSLETLIFSCPLTPLLPTPCSLHLLNFASTPFFLASYSNKPSQNVSANLSLSFHSRKLLEHASDLPHSQDRVCKVLTNSFLLTCLTENSALQWSVHTFPYLLLESCTVVKAYTREIYQTRSSRDVVWHTAVWNQRTWRAWPHIIFRIF